MRLICVLLLFLLIAGPAGAQLRISSATCNGQVQPTGVPGQGIFFGWEMQGTRHNQVQKAWQVILADDATLNPRRLLWNSGRVQSSKSLNNRCTKLLLAGKIYFWRVRVWDGDNRVSSWSSLYTFTTALASTTDWKGARWIGYAQLPAPLRIMPGTHAPQADTLGGRNRKRAVIPLFRKDFQASKRLLSATVFVGGIGHYALFLNGTRVGNAFLSPGWTDYRYRTLYNTYDVTSMVKQGANALSALVGTGFAYINRERYFKITTAYSYPKLIVRLKLDYSDGTEENVVTNQSWQCAPSAITFSSMYGGEDWDARLEQDGWQQAGYKPVRMQQALELGNPDSTLRPEGDYPVRLVEKISPQKKLRLNDSTMLIDFGRNLSGIIRLTVNGQLGQVLRITPAELLQGQRPNQKASGSPYYFNYTLRGGASEVFEPLFSYYGFRYVLVEGLTPATDMQEIVMLHNRNAAPATGSFVCSNTLFNRIDTLIRRAIASNLQSVVTDCPHREKLGWLEQDHLMGASIQYNYNISLLYRKLVHDMMDAQTPEGLVPDIAPAYTVFQGGFYDSPEWGSSAVILPWLLYRWYDDRETLREAWPMMKRYVEYLGTKAKAYILNYGLGDWFDYGPREPGESQLTPKALTATAIWYEDAQLLGHMARLLNDRSAQVRYTLLADSIRQAFNRRFFNAQKKVYATGSQTAMAMPLVLNLVPAQDQADVVQNLRDSIRAHRYALTAGDVGFHYLISALDRFGASDELFAMNNRDDVPGYGFQLKRGATALTESWPALENVSNNHLMLGHLMEWLYSGVAGISQADSSTAYHHLLIRPQPVGDLRFARGRFHTPYGWVYTDWERTKNRFTLKVHIPVNTRATILFPVQKVNSLNENGRAIQPLTRLERGSGDYVFTVE